MIYQPSKSTIFQPPFDERVCKSCSKSVTIQSQTEPNDLSDRHLDARSNADASVSRMNPISSEAILYVRK